MRRAPPVLAVLLLAAALAAPAAAQAPPPVETIEGSPLVIHANGVGQLQARFEGSREGEFSPPDADAASAGFHLAVDLNGQAPTLYGYEGPPATPFTPVSQGTVAGKGTAADPFRLETQYDAQIADGRVTLRVTQTVRYVDGESELEVSYSILYLEADDIQTTVRPTLSADVHLGLGVGFLDEARPRAVGGVNQALGASAAIVEATDWYKYEANDVKTVFEQLADLSLTGGLKGEVLDQPSDNAVAVQWANIDLCGICGDPPASSLTYKAIWRFTRFDALALSPQAASLAAGGTHTVTATAHDRNGAPAPGQTIRYEVTGANSTAGAATTGSDGTAVLSWTDFSPGTDTLTAYADLNGNARPDSHEPQETATADWVAAPAPLSSAPAPALLSAAPSSAPPPVEAPAAPASRPGRPRFAETFNVELVRGSASVRVATRPRRALASARKGLGPVIPLTKLGRQVPFGSRVDTSKGEVKLTVASTPKGTRTESGNFFDGIFTVLQRRLGKAERRRRAQATADVVLKGGNFRARCGVRPKGGGAYARRPGRASARRRRSVRRLWGNGRGRFRTRGRYSSATVRGTLWLTEDRCDGTLTRVRSGRVQVRDFVLRRTIAVLAGKSHLARAPR